MDLGIQKKNMLESKIQKSIIDRYESNGYYVIKLIKTNRNGIPDLICIKENEFFFIEVKQQNGVVSKLQKFRHKELKEKGINVLILTS